MAGSPRLIRFLTVGAVLGVLWYFFYYNVLLVDMRFDRLLVRTIAEMSVRVLNGLGFMAARPPGTAIVLMNKIPTILVGWQCDGMPLYALFSIFILSYPGPWVKKIWFIPLGVVAIFAVNILRVVALAINQFYWRSTMEFNHHYTFLIVVYGFIFWLWTVWVRRYGDALTSTANSERPIPVDPSASSSHDRG